MARGFESKSVADQQEAAQAPRASRDEDARPPALLARRRLLELSRIDVERRLALAQAPALRQTLEGALRAIDAELSRLR
jgi:hypothetical protein